MTLVSGYSSGPLRDLSTAQCCTDDGANELLDLQQNGSPSSEHVLGLVGKNLSVGLKCPNLNDCKQTILSVFDQYCTLLKKVNFNDYERREACCRFGDSIITPLLGRGMPPESTFVLAYGIGGVRVIDLILSAVSQAGEELAVNERKGPSPVAILMGIKAMGSRGGDVKQLVQDLLAVAEKQPSVIIFDCLDNYMEETDLVRPRDIAQVLLKLSQISSKRDGRYPLVVVGITDIPWEVADSALSIFTTKTFLSVPDENSRKLYLQERLKVLTSRDWKADLGCLPIDALSSGLTVADLERSLLAAAKISVVRATKLSRSVKTSEQNWPERSVQSYAVLPIEAVDLVEGLRTTRSSMTLRVIKEMAVFERRCLSVGLSA